MTDRSCILCGDSEAEESAHIALPCRSHSACKDCLPGYFWQAAHNESQYPPSCCDQIFMLQEYLEHLPEDVVSVFLAKQEEYSVLAKYRVYCANNYCSKFLSPQEHITDTDTTFVYAICFSDNCGSITCVNCKGLIAEGIDNHECGINEEDEKFKEVAEKEGYQSCDVCTRTIELAEACNHITCECGYSFCYVCGKQWEGMHGCPQYGPAIYDDDGYNQEGFHRVTGLNEHSRTRREQIVHDHGEEGDIEIEGEDEEEDEDDDEANLEEFLRNLERVLGDEQIDIIRAMSPEEREETITMLRIDLLGQGVVFVDRPLQEHDDDEHHGDGEAENDEDDQARQLEHISEDDEPEYRENIDENLEEPENEQLGPPWAAAQYLRDSNLYLRDSENAENEYLDDAENEYLEEPENEYGEDIWAQFSYLENAENDEQDVENDEQDASDYGVHVPGSWDLPPSEWDTFQPFGPGLLEQQVGYWDESATFDFGDDVPGDVHQVNISEVPFFYFSQLELQNESLDEPTTAANSGTNMPGAFPEEEEDPLAARFNDLRDRLDAIRSADFEDYYTSFGTGQQDGNPDHPTTSEFRDLNRSGEPMIMEDMIHSGAANPLSSVPTTNTETPLVDETSTEKAEDTSDDECWGCGCTMI